jgi:RND family efflux transporter MFP subunit
LSQLQLSKSNDPLAALRIDRSERPRPRSRWLGKIVMLCLLLALVAAGAYAWINYGEMFLRAEVRVASVEVRPPGVADSVLQAQGYLKSRTQAAIGAKVAGRVSNVFVEEGQTVPKDFVLAELEHRDVDRLLDAMRRSVDAMKASVDAMAASLEKSELELSEAKRTFEQDRRDWDRAEQLLPKKGISAADHEKTKSKWEASNDRCKSLEAAVRLANARLEEAKARQAEAEDRIRETEEQRENYLVKSPFPGTVISKEAEVGESIMPGGMGAASGRGSVVTLANLLNLEVETDVKEDYVGRVRVGQQVNVSVDGVPDRRFTGTVRTIIPMGDRAKGTVKVKVKLSENEVREVNDLNAQRFTLFPEMAATVHFMSEGKEAYGGKVEPQIYAPADAIRKDDNGEFVWQVVNQRVKRVSVETGDSRDGRVFIQRGLKGGEQVVINAPTSLKEDLPIKVVQ